jgi:hypothetical protein
MGKKLGFGLLSIAIILTIAAVAGSRWRQPTDETVGPALEHAPVTISRDIAANALSAKAGAPASAALAGVSGGTVVHAAQSASSRFSVVRPQIARTGNVTLFVENADAAVSTLSDLARKAGGDVFSLQFQNASDSSAASGQMTIRVPSDRFDATMTAIGQVGKVRERSVTGEDLTGNISDSSARLRNLLRTEDDIRKIMDRGGSVEDIMDVENQLSQVREQIETLESDVKTMRDQVSYSTIAVSFSAEGANATVEPAAFAQLGNAWHGALHAMTQMTVNIVAGLLWLIVFAPYIAAAALVAFVVRSRVRRWRTGAPAAS